MYLILVSVIHVSPNVTGVVSITVNYVLYLGPWSERI